jgi:hypothetical protein
VDIEAGGCREKIEEEKTRLLEKGKSPSKEFSRS